MLKILFPGTVLVPFLGRGNCEEGTLEMLKGGGLPRHSARVHCTNEFPIFSFSSTGMESSTRGKIHFFKPEGRRLSRNSMELARTSLDRLRLSPR